MPFRALAELILVVHAAFIAFVVLGALLAIRWPRVMWAHLPACAWAVLLELRGWVCPLTPLENWLRRAGGDPAYSAGFVEHYLAPVVYPPGLDSRVQVLLAVSVVLINAALYLCVFRVRRARVRPARSG